MTGKPQLQNGLLTLWIPGWLCDFELGFRSFPYDGGAHCVCFKFNEFLHVKCVKSARHSLMAICLPKIHVLKPQTPLAIFGDRMFEQVIK